MQRYIFYFTLKVNIKKISGKAILTLISKEFSLALIRIRGIELIYYLKCSSTVGLVLIFGTIFADTFIYQKRFTIPHCY